MSIQRAESSMSASFANLESEARIAAEQPPRLPPTVDAVNYEECLSCQ